MIKRLQTRRPRFVDDAISRYDACPYPRRDTHSNVLQRHLPLSAGFRALTISELRTTQADDSPVFLRSAFSLRTARPSLRYFDYSSPMSIDAKMTSPSFPLILTEPLLSERVAIPT
ncbi:hypothetical protein QCA50_008279 [Cerrena zonata]|uniref:Uncharacterized protein n=1 Tax=Cerrena zonata TaxID=2478898 RepID=A0AAW0G5K7_9APHY